MNEIAVTKCKTIQIGMDEYRDTFITKIFPITSTIEEIIKWAEVNHINEVTISSVVK